MKLKTSETNIYYTLKALETNNLTSLKYRQLKNRIKLLLDTKKEEIGNKIYKDKTWFIHYSIVDLFQAKRVHDKSKVRAIKYKNEVSINLPDNYDIKFYKYLGETIIKHLKRSKTIYSIEQSPSENNKYHLHLGTTATIDNICKQLKVIEKMLTINILKNKNTKIVPIRNLTQFVNYIAKQNQELVTRLKYIS